MRPDQSAADVLRRHDPDVTSCEVAEEFAVLLEADGERPHVENDRAGDKESWRAGEPGVQRGEPIGERLGGLEDVGQEGLSSKLQRLSGAYFRVRVHHPIPLAFR